MKVYAVYSIPKSPEYRLEGLFKSKQSAKKFIEDGVFKCWENHNKRKYDIQIETIQE